MTYHQKLATLIIRLIASAATIIGLLGLAVMIIQEHSPAAIPYQVMSPSVYLYFPMYVIPGVLAYPLSPLLGRFIGKGL